MAKIDVTLPVRELARSVEFFHELGFSFDPGRTGDDAACMIVGEDVNVLLLTEDRFRQVTDKEVADPKKTTEAVFCLNVESRDDVGRIVEMARGAGALDTSDPTDHGTQFWRSFDDPDGHIWEVVWTDPSHKQV